MWKVVFLSMQEWFRLPVFLILLLIFSFSCGEKKEENLLFGKWKAVELKLRDKSLDEDHLGAKYYEFMPNGDVWVTTKGESVRKTYQHGPGYLIDPESGKRMEILSLTKYELRIRSEAEDGQTFYLNLRRVKK